MLEFWARQFRLRDEHTQSNSTPRPQEPITMVVSPIRAVVAAILLVCIASTDAQVAGMMMNLPALVMNAMLRHRQASPLTFEQKKDKAIAFVRKQMEQFAVPGMALTVVFKNKTVLTEGFGTKQFGRLDTPVTSTTQFQIGSVSKTFTALCIAKLVDDGNVQWSDRVKQHLNWTLMDKYAEEHTTLSDLLAMNSVFGTEDSDFSWSMGLYPTEEEAIAALSLFNTTRPLRAGWSYSNINYEILGQVVAAVTNQTWFDYLDAAILKPLGMHDTVPFAAKGSQLSHGHKVCNGNVAGPFDLLSDTIVSPPLSFGPIAAGSIVSTAADMATLTTFLLNKGQGLFKSPSVIGAMTTGHEVIDGVTPELLEFMGYFSYKPAGNVIGAGYGFDFAGNILFGKDYFSKNGATATFMAETAYVPSHQLGVTLLMNAIPMGGDLRATMLTAQIRSYVAGLFLDIPDAELDAMHDQAMDHLLLVIGGQVPACDVHMFDNKPLATPGVTMSSQVRASLVGAYTASNAFYGHATITAQGNDLVLQYGNFSGALYPTKDVSKLLWDSGVYVSPITVQGPGRFVMQGKLSFVRS
ncbi:Aste57867_20496 [Aphanomyces stellatus]|uniref:Aste57867_20496 protein n=1 Tax=Aphanomyces stellatus TaxID=120398 RepID=A0A485LFT1_9STRA|nr:hypothetical protein As57867_020430 [Aphanomyces stellatus]VFT97181.1 Aste57867_20496 [Aphanomyces stellatus]